MKPMYVKNRAAALYVGQRVREFRRSVGLSQEDLARRVFGVARNGPVSNIERGQRRVSAVELWRISRVLNRSLDEFFPEPFPAPGGKGSQGGPREGGRPGQGARRAG
jgi:transcriptional regulator with XRE-family HTH domain